MGCVFVSKKSTTKQNANTTHSHTKSKSISNLVRQQETIDKQPNFHQKILNKFEKRFDPAPNENEKSYINDMLEKSYINDMQEKSFHNDIKEKSFNNDIQEKSFNNDLKEKSFINDIKQLPSNTQNKNIFPSKTNTGLLYFSEIEKSTTHSDKCIYGDNNTIFWRADCGGYLCAPCSKDVTKSQFQNVLKNCPKCGAPIINISFVSQLGNTQKIKTQTFKMASFKKGSNAPIQANLHTNINTAANDNIDPTIQIFEDNPIELLLCEICLDKPKEKKINCGSIVDHMLCTDCYNNLILSHRIQLCPFCREEIKGQ